MPARVAAKTMAVGMQPRIGLHGELVDWVGPGPLYHLGNGARSYDPVPQRFLRMDPYSPFSAGGFNPYAFCDADPVNRSDPSGYASYRVSLGMVFAALGVALSLGTFAIAAVTMFGLAYWAGSISMMLGVASGVTGIISSQRESADPQLARVLGWVSTGLGVAASLVGLLPIAVASFVKASGRYLKGTMGGARALYSNKDESLHFLFRESFLDGSLVTTHGEPGALQGTRGTFYPAAEWAARLSLNAKYRLSPRNTPLYLMSCGAGTGGLNSNAAVISRVLKREVVSFASPATIGVQQGERYLFYGSTLGHLVRYKNGAPLLRA